MLYIIVSLRLTSSLSLDHEQQLYVICWVIMGLNVYGINQKPIADSE